MEHISEPGKKVLCSWLGENWENWEGGGVEWETSHFFVNPNTPLAYSLHIYIFLQIFELLTNIDRKYLS